MDIITKLYQNEKFPIYLGVIIVILIIIFFIVYMLGKKDSDSLSKTKRVEKVDNNNDDLIANETPLAPVMSTNPFLSDEKTREINLNEIKEDHLSVEAIAHNIENEIKSYVDTLPDDETVYDNTGAPEQTDDEPRVISLTTIANNIEKEVEGYMMAMPLEEEPVIETKPIENEKPFAEEEYTNVNEMLAKDREMLEETNRQIEKYQDLAASIEKELAELEQKHSNNEPLLKEEKEDLLLSFKEEPETKKVEVFSSVSIPQKEDDLINDTMQIELPKLKK